MHQQQPLCSHFSCLNNTAKEACTCECDHAKYTRAYSKKAVVNWIILYTGYNLQRSAWSLAGGEETAHWCHCSDGIPDHQHRQQLSCHPFHPDNTQQISIFRRKKIENFFIFHLPQRECNMKYLVNHRHKANGPCPKKAARYHWFLFSCKPVSE